MNRKEIVAETVLPRRVIKFATVWERFGSFVIDLLIILLLYVLLSARIYIPYGWLVIAWLYESVQVSGMLQATIGQRIMGIKVSNRQGGTLDFTEASLRHFSKYISVFTALSGYLMIILDKKRQCLHDKITGSLVVTSESYQALAT